MILCETTMVHTHHCALVKTHGITTHTQKMNGNMNYGLRMQKWVSVGSLVATHAPF